MSVVESILRQDLDYLAGLPAAAKCDTTIIRSAWLFMVNKFSLGFSTDVYNGNVMACVNVTGAYLAKDKFKALKSVPAIVACPSACDCHNKEVWCESRGLTSVPVDIPADTRMLFLFDNKITTIPDGSLSRLKSLRLLSLSSNRLNDSAFKPSLFLQLKQLQNLELSDNRLTSIPRNAFAGMPNVVRIYLENNKISSIDRDALKNMSNLLELKLSNNRLSDFPKIVACPALSRLCLGGNELVRLRPDGLRQVNLEHLELSRNRLNQLPSTFFGGLSNMRVLDISSNQIHRVPQIISNMTSLQTLNLSHNPITTLDGNFLTNLRRMKTLDLGSLQLSTLSEGFIPRGVYLNFLDLTNNPWNCDCAISWLTNFMRRVRGAFRNVNQAKCSQPPELTGRPLIALYQRDCSGSPGKHSGANNIPQPSPTSRRPNIDLCAAMACANGATCYINRTSFRPVCRCLTGYKGMLCDKPLYRPTPSTSTTTSTTAIASNTAFRPQLIIQSDTLTPNSVQIMLPSTRKRLKVSVAQIFPNGIIDRSPREFRIRPTAHPYTVTNLEPGKRYKICISSTDVIQTSLQSRRIVEDKLCGEVTTLPITIKPPVEEVTTEHEGDGDGGDTIVKGDGGDNGDNTNAGQETGDDCDIVKQPSGGNAPVADPKTDSDFKLLYPTLGASLGAFIILILVILFFVCYRNKRKLKQADNRSVGSRGHAEYVAGKTGDQEIVPTVTHQRRQYQQQTSVPLLGQNGDVYHTPTHSYPLNGASPQRVGTPNKTGSLGSSNSDGSVSGVPQNHPIDMQKCCTTAARVMHSVAPMVNSEELMRCSTTPSSSTCQSNDGPYNDHPTYTTGHGSVLTSRRQECVYPVRSTDTVVNQFHQRPIATTTVIPATTYQLNNPVTMPGYQARPQPVLMHYTPGQQQRYTNSHADHYNQMPMSNGQILKTV
ncbi:vasorin-like [Clavelina lepadiformis]|uniref:vasorin-like n=1 Tax=Clavelina lepadiformis TaxID=159417 RepID=UPI00404225C7